MSILVGNPFFLDAGAGAGGPSEISRSLRFNSSDSAYLSRVPSTAGNRKTWTWAGWVKRSEISANHVLLGAFPGSGNYSLIQFLADNRLRVLNVVAGNIVSNRVTTRVFRDPSAWYHLVVSSNSSTSLKVYINGVEETAFDITTGPDSSDWSFNNNSEQTIGQNSVAGGSYFNGYLADLHLIDGQALTPSSFTEVSAITGQLIPKKYSGSFGTNGFWLQFSDNSATTSTTLGKDYSGRGNNWTPNNFSVEKTTPNYSSNYTGSINSNASWADAFDGNASSGFIQAVYGNPYTETDLTLPAGVTWSSQIRVNTIYYSNGGGLVINGTTVNSALTDGGSQVWVDLTSVLGSSGTLSTIKVYQQNTNYVRLYAIELDGVVLNNSQGSNNDSLTDTPSSYGTDTGLGGEVRGNYCTLNPLGNSVSAPPYAPSNGNLQLTNPSGTSGGTVGTFAIPSGKWYFEYVMSSRNETGPFFGIAEDDRNLTLDPGLNSTNIYGFYVNPWLNLVSNGTELWSSFYGAFNSVTAVDKDVFQIAIDATNSSSVKLWMGRNNTWYGASNGVFGNPSAGTNNSITITSGQTLFAYLAIRGPSSAATLNANFGQRQFSFQAPSGFKSLCDTNLPAPTIAKPSEVMDVKLYTGNGSTQTISGLGFSPDLVWIKGRSDSFFHRLYDTIRGTTKALYSNSTDIEGLYQNDYENFTAFNADGFSLGTTTISNGLNSNNGTFVAWNWDAGSSTVTNTAGSISSSVRANASAGFSIVTASVSASASGPTIGHGLGVTPALVIGKNRSAGIPWYVWSSSLAANNKLIFNSTAAAVTDTNTWGAMTSSTLQMGATGTSVSTAWIVAGTQDVVFYCFAPVAGYSSFGSYTGNGSSDGPFVFCGFRPRWILIKNSSSAGWDWSIRDTSRDPYNPSQQRLWANTSAAESTNDPYDILSNGFKLRINYGDFNASSNTYVWAAFAENPFQYARAR